MNKNLVFPDDLDHVDSHMVNLKLEPTDLQRIIRSNRHQGTNHHFNLSYFRRWWLQWLEPGFRFKYYKSFLFLSGYFNGRFSARFLGHFSINYWKRIWDESHSFLGNISLGSNCSLSIYNQLLNIWNKITFWRMIW